MKNKFKVITFKQMEDVLQIAVNSVTNGKTSYTKKDVLLLLNLIYNQLVSQASKNVEVGMYLQEVENEPIN